MSLVSHVIHTIFNCGGREGGRDEEEDDEEEEDCLLDSNHRILMIGRVCGGVYGGVGHCFGGVFPRHGTICVSPPATALVLLFAWSHCQAAIA